MAALTWSFDEPQKRAVAVAAHGTYVVIGEDDKRWFTQFTRADRLAKAPAPPADHAYFFSLDDARQSCQRHADRYSDDGSNRFMTTPVP